MYAREERDRKRGEAPLPRPRPDTALPSTAASVLSLQRSAGNDAVSRHLSNQGRQRPLVVQRVGGGGPLYRDGTYGARNRERQYLEDEYGEPIDGNRTHQAEHPILYSAAAPSSRTGVRRGQSGQSGQNARYVENSLPAYYETYQEHRDHDGTGTRRRDRIGTTGLTQAQYREAQRAALEEANNPANAMHMNMIGYANQPGFRNPAPTPAIRQSDDSYDRMLRGSGSSPFFDSAGQVRRTRRLTRQERADLYAGRRVARGGAYPDQAEQDRIMQQFGTHSHQLRSEGPTDLSELTTFPDLGSDRSRSPQELDTSYYRDRSRSRRRARSRGPRPSQREQLEMLARGQDVDVNSEDERDRGRSRSRRAQSRAASRSRIRAASIAPRISDVTYLDENERELPRGRSRSRRAQSRAASRSRTRAASIAPSISEHVMYLDEDERELPRARSRSRARSHSRHRGRSTSRYGARSSADLDISGNYGYGAGDYDYDDGPVYSQPTHWSR